MTSQDISAGTEAVDDSILLPLSNKAIKFVFKEVRKVLLRKADPIITSAAHEIGFRVHKTLHQAASATPKSDELLELVDGTHAEALIQKALCGLLGKLESAMLSTFDANISGRVIKLGSMLLSQLHGDATSLGELKKVAESFDEVLSDQLLGSKLTSGRVESALKLKQLVQSVDNTGNIDADKFEKLTKSLTEIGGGTLPFKLSFDAISQDGLVTTAKLEQWIVDESENETVRKWVNRRVVAKYLLAGKIGEQLCGDRVASSERGDRVLHRCQCQLVPSAVQHIPACVLSQPRRVDASRERTG